MLKYWKYFDVVIVIAIVPAIIGVSIGIYGVYTEIVKLGSSIEIYLALIGIILTIFPIFIAVLLAVLGTKGDESRTEKMN